jgi:hypothetical protein
MGASCSSDQTAAVSVENQAQRPVSPYTSRLVATSAAPFLTYLDHFEQIDASRRVRPRYTARENRTSMGGIEIRNLIRAIDAIEGLFHLFGNPGAMNNVAIETTQATGVRGPPPACKEAVRQLPKVALENCNDCGICCEQQEMGHVAVRLPCGHVFHLLCIKPWLNRHCTCPTCRYEIQTSDSSYEPGRLERMRLRDELAGTQLDIATHLEERGEESPKANEESVGLCPYVYP